jgi:hypothetical protein
VSQWTVPPPPLPLPGGRPRPPIRTGKVFLGIGLAILGHLVVIGAIVLVAYVSQDLNASLIVGLVGELVLFVACLAVGIVWITRRDRGIGVGLLIGWAVGALVLPVVGFGVCVALVSGTNGGNL